MHIAQSVTRQAITVQRSCTFPLERILRVATLASDLDVSSIQTVLGLLVVVKVPQGPGTGVVATLAEHTQLLFVFVLFLMTGKTVSRCILEKHVLVATLASGGQMTPGQRKLRQGMIEHFDPPGPVAVARLACRTGLTLVLVVFFVATVAIQRRFAQTSQIFMTGRTLDR